MLHPSHAINQNRAVIFLPAFVITAVNKSTKTHIRSNAILLWFFELQFLETVYNRKERQTQESYSLLDASQSPQDIVIGHIYLSRLAHDLSIKSIGIAVFNNDQHVRPPASVSLLYLYCVYTRSLHITKIKGQGSF